jgi:hypothetical protein
MPTVRDAIHGSTLALPVLQRTPLPREIRADRDDVTRFADVFSAVLAFLDRR